MTNDDRDQARHDTAGADQHPAGEIEIRPRSLVGLRVTALLGMATVMSTVTEHDIFTYSVR